MDSKQGGPHDLILGDGANNAYNHMPSFKLVRRHSAYIVFIVLVSGNGMQVILNSDQGSVYSSMRHHLLAKKLGFIPSMSRKTNGQLSRVSSLI